MLQIGSSKDWKLCTYLRSEPLKQLADAQAKRHLDLWAVHPRITAALLAAQPARDSRLQKLYRD